MEKLAIVSAQIIGSLILFFLATYVYELIVLAVKDYMQHRKTISILPDEDVLKGLHDWQGKNNTIPADVMLKMEAVIKGINLQPTATAFANLGTAMQGAAKPLTDFFTMLGNSYERVIDEKHWRFTKPYFDKRDLWLGVYWNYADEDDEFLFDIDCDELTIYICLIPTIVFKMQRTRIYRIIPKVDTRIDPVCWSCGLPHSIHPVDKMNNLASGESTCNGKFTL